MPYVISNACDFIITVVNNIEKIVTLISVPLKTNCIIWRPAWGATRTEVAGGSR